MEINYIAILKQTFYYNKHTFNSGNIDKTNITVLLLFARFQQRGRERMTEKTIMTFIMGIYKIIGQTKKYI